jgi:hypothetical protein
MYLLQNSRKPPKPIHNVLPHQQQQYYLLFLSQFIPQCINFPLQLFKKFFLFPLQLLVVNFYLTSMVSNPLVFPLYVIGNCLNACNITLVALSMQAFQITPDVSYLMLLVYFLYEISSSRYLGQCCDCLSGSLC